MDNIKWGYRLIVIGVLLSSFVLFTVVGNRIHDKYINTMTDIEILQNKVDSMQIQLDAQSLHFKDCAFISKEDINMDNRGYFYSKSRRK